MIDIHNHSLFQVDDGSQSLDESLVLLKQAYDQGVTDVVLTPHFVMDDAYHVKREELVEKMNVLQNALNEKEISVRLHCGHELYIHRLLPHCLKERRCCTLADSRYVLVEFPFDSYQKHYDEILEDLRALGYIVVIAHPERYRYVREDVNFCLRWLDEGDLLQCNQNSFLRKDTQKLMKKMLKCNMISFISSDCHSEKRPVYLKEAYDAVSSLVGKDECNVLFHLNAEKVLKNELIVNDQYSAHKKIFGLF